MELIHFTHDRDHCLILVNTNNEPSNFMKDD
jgi:hypothetical protein